jgi:hypothetical protein
MSAAAAQHGANLSCWRTNSLISIKSCVVYVAAACADDAANAASICNSGMGIKACNSSQITA